MKEVEAILKRGGVGVLVTDTIYGVVGQALDKKTVERIYRVKKRTPTKPFIILIASIRDLKRFGITLDLKTLKLLDSLWSEKVSIVLPCASAKFKYLHRGTNSLAFRLPKPVWLRTLLKKTGPLVAPSANPEGLTPATTIAQAKKYFGGQVDFYENRGRRQSVPSTLVRIKNGKIIIVRKGAVKI